MKKIVLIAALCFIGFSNGMSAPVRGDTYSVVGKSDDQIDFEIKLAKAAADRARAADDRAERNSFRNRLAYANEKLVGVKDYDPTAIFNEDWLPDIFHSTGKQLYEQAKREWIAAALRNEIRHGAIGQDEYDRFDKIYFPQSGDSSELVALKAQARRHYVDVLRGGAGAKSSGDRVGVKSDSTWEEAQKAGWK